MHSKYINTFWAECRILSQFSQNCENRRYRELQTVSGLSQGFVHETLTKPKIFYCYVYVFLLYVYV
jgi:hypothetical protein